MYICPLNTRKCLSFILRVKSGSFKGENRLTSFTHCIHLVYFCLPEYKCGVVAYFILGAYQSLTLEMELNSLTLSFCINSCLGLVGEIYKYMQVEKENITPKEESTSFLGCFIMVTILMLIVGCIVAIITGDPMDILRIFDSGGGGIDSRP